MIIRVLLFYRTRRAGHFACATTALATDPGFVPDIHAFSKRTGHPLLAVENVEDGFRALIRRAH